MTYTEKELDQFLHGISLSLLSKKSAQHWRYDEETAKEIEWLEVLERKVRADKADRETEPTGYKTKPVEDEPTISKMEQVDKDINVRSKTMRDCYNCKIYETEGECIKCHYEPKDEPQICDTCRYYNDYIPCGSTPSACKEADKFAKEFAVALMKLKPQTERSE